MDKTGALRCPQTSFQLHIQRKTVVGASLATDHHFRRRFLPIHRTPITIHSWIRLHVKITSPALTTFTVATFYGAWDALRRVDEYLGVDRL